MPDPSDFLVTDASIAAVHALLRGVGAAGLLTSAGLACFLVVTARGLRLPPAARGRALTLARATAAVAVGAALLVVPVAGAYRLGTGWSSLLGADVWSADLVGADVLVLGLQAVGLALALRLARAERGPAEALPTAQVLLAGLGVLSPALVGHTRAYRPSALLVLTDGLHLAAGAVWLGGLVALALVLPAVAGRPRDAAALVARFSALAAGLLVALVVSGTLLGWRILGSAALLTEETYGRLLLAKVALAALAAAIAAGNRWWLLPRVAGASGGLGHADQRAAATLLGRAVRVEAALVVLAALVSGFLTQAAP